MNLGYPPHHDVSLRPGYRGTSLQEFHALFPDEASCLHHIFKTRFGERLLCDKCGKPGLWYLMRAARRFQHPCGRSISPTAGTIFSGTTTDLRIWLYAILHFSNSSEGINTPFLSRHLGISYKAAFRMGRLIRLHMASLDFGLRLGIPDGLVLVLLERTNAARASISGTRRGAHILLLSDGQSVQSTIIMERRRHILRKVINDKIVSGAIPVTNCYITHRVSSEFGSRRPFIAFDNRFGEKGSEIFNSNLSFMGYISRPLHDHHRSISHDNLWIYLKEMEFRFNRRHNSWRIFLDAVAKFPILDEENISMMRSWNFRSKV